MSNNGDDYEDDLESAEGEDFADDEQSGDEDWDSYDDQQGDENLDEEDGSTGDESAPQKKKSSLFSIILIGVAVIGVGGFLLTQMGKGGAPAPVATADQPAAPAVEPVQTGMLGSPEELAKLQDAMAKHAAGQQAAPAETPAVQTPPAPMAAIPESSPSPVTPSVAVAPVVPEVPAPKEVLDAKTPPMPTALAAPEPALAAAPSETLAPAPAVIPADQPAVAVLDAPPVLVKDESKVQDGATHMPKVQDIMLKASPEAPEVTPAPAPTASGNADTEALNIRINTLLTRIASLETEVTTLRDKAGEADSLKATIDTLQKKLETASEASPARPAKKAAETPDQPVETKATPQILGTSSDSQASVTTEPEIKKSPVARSVKVSSVWVLKGAQPGQAMVAKAGENDSRTVGVGDTLPGIGRITAVEYQNGRWAVIGTQGRINQ